MFSARFLAPLAAAAITLAAPQIVEAGVVVASSGPSATKYPKGKKLKDTDRITLRAGDSVTVLDAKGTRVLRGPGTRMVGARGASRRSTFAALTRRGSARKARTGAVRSGSDTGEPTRNLWQIDVTSSGTMCLAEGAEVQLWRPSTEGSATYVLADTDTAAHLHVTFEDGQRTAPVDTARLPLDDGHSFTLAGPGGAGPMPVRFAPLGAIGADPEGLAGALIENGCDAQLDLLSETMLTETS